MLAEFKAENIKDENGNPSGGSVRGTGLTIDWQNGPLGRDGDRKKPNGASVETAIAAVRQRIEAYQDSKFNCQTNAEAIEHLTAALAALNRRTAEREARAVEGTHVA